MKPGWCEMGGTRLGKDRRPALERGIHAAITSIRERVVKRRKCHHPSASLAALIALAAAREASSQLVEPQWLRLRLNEISAGAYAESEYQQTSANGGSATTYTRTFAGPSLGLNVDGSIYHPNLFRYF